MGVKFTVPSFRSGGVEYLSAEVEEAANAGNEEALNLIKKLIEKGASCIEVVESAKKPSNKPSNKPAKKSDKDNKPEEEPEEEEEEQPEEEEGVDNE